MLNSKLSKIRKSLLSIDDEHSGRDNNHFDLYAMSKGDGEDSMKSLRFDPKQFTDVPSNFYFHGSDISPRYAYKNGERTSKISKFLINGLTVDQLKQAHSVNMPSSSLMWPLVFKGIGFKDLISAFHNNDIQISDSADDSGLSSIEDKIFYIDHLSVAIYPKWVAGGFNGVQILGDFKLNDFAVLE